MNFEFDKKQAIENAVHESELNHQQTVKNIFIGCFALILIFSVFLFKSYKKTYKQKGIIEIQKQIVEHKNKEITDSINYAQRIQRAILPSKEYMKKLFPDHWVNFAPKDILSGDFFWCYYDGQSKYLATADSTGHGIPASLMSVIGSAFLNEIVIERKITRPDLVLNTLRQEIIKVLNQEGADEERKDGMDISFLKITDDKLDCACANNPIYIIRGKDLIEIKADRFPVGKYVKEDPFTLKEIDLLPGDTIYTLSDGYIDQFNEQTGKKLMSKRFKEWIIELSSSTMPEIQDELTSRFSKWKGSGEQIDDVTVISVRV